MWTPCWGEEAAEPGAELAGRAGVLPSVTERKVLSLHRAGLLEGVLFFSESGLPSISSVVLGHHMLYSTLCQSC